MIKKKVTKSNKINHMSLDLLVTRLDRLKSRTYTTKEGVTRNCPQDNSVYAKHLREQIKILTL